MDCILYNSSIQPEYQILWEKGIKNCKHKHELKWDFWPSKAHQSKINSYIMTFYPIACNKAICSFCYQDGLNKPEKLPNISKQTANFWPKLIWVRTRQLLMEVKLQLTEHLILYTSNTKWNIEENRWFDRMTNDCLLVKHFSYAFAGTRWHM